MFLPQETRKIKEQNKPKTSRNKKTKKDSSRNQRK